MLLMNSRIYFPWFAHVQEQTSPVIDQLLFVKCFEEIRVVFSDLAHRYDLKIKLKILLVNPESSHLRYAH